MQEGKRKKRSHAKAQRRKENQSVFRMNILRRSIFAPLGEQLYPHFENGMCPLPLSCISPVPPVVHFFLLVVNCQGSRHSAPLTIADTMME